MHAMAVDDGQGTPRVASRRRGGLNCARACIAAALAASLIVCVLLLRRADGWQHQAALEAGRAEQLHQQLLRAQQETAEARQQHHSAIASHAKDRHSDGVDRGRLETQLKEALRVIERARLSKRQEPGDGAPPRGVEAAPPSAAAIGGEAPPPLPPPTPRPQPGKCVKERTSVARGFADVGNLSAAGSQHLGNDEQWANACGLRCAAAQQCAMWTYCKTCQACWLYSGGETAPAPANYERWSGARGCVNPLVPPLGFTKVSEEGYWQRNARQVREKDMTIASCGARCAGQPPGTCSAFSVMLNERRAEEGLGQCFHYDEGALDQPFTQQKGSRVFVRGSVRSARARREAMQRHPAHQMLQQLFGGRPVRLAHSSPGGGMGWHPLSRFPFNNLGSVGW